MAFCGKCGTQIEDGTNLCPQCAAQATQENTPGATANYAVSDAEQNKAMAILAYFGILVLIPLFAAKESPFARYHTNQGLVLAIACIAYGIVYSVLSGILLAISWRLYFLVSIIGFVSIAFVVLAVMGIINAANGRMKELPVIGKIRILK